MSASTSQRLPSRGSPSTDLPDGHGYEGGDAVLAAWFQGLAPNPDLTVSGWADRHRRLTSVASAEPGAWRTERTPYLRAVMDDLSPSSAVERVVFMKGAQLGGTLGRLVESMRLVRTEIDVDGDGDTPIVVARLGYEVVYWTVREVDDDSAPPSDLRLKLFSPFGPPVESEYQSLTSLMLQT
jgi:hypothetical protein